MGIDNVALNLKTGSESIAIITNKIVIVSCEFQVNVMTSMRLLWKQKVL